MKAEFRKPIRSNAITVAGSTREPFQILSRKEQGEGGNLWNPKRETAWRRCLIEIQPTRSHTVLLQYTLTLTVKWKEKLKKREAVVGP